MRETEREREREQIRYFDFLKPFGYIDRVVKFDFFKKLILIHKCATCSELQSYLSTIEIYENDLLFLLFLSTLNIFPSWPPYTYEFPHNSFILDSNSEHVALA